MSTALVARVAAVAEADPSREALGEGERRLAYGALLGEARRLASALLERGLERGDRVALVLPNCIEGVVAWYAAWIAGAVVVPLNAQARARDIARWLAHAEARVVVHEAGDAEVEAALASMNEGAPARVVAERAERGSTAVAWSLPASPLRASAHGSRGPDDLAVVLYTSGTTGSPKGVMLSHANVAANADAIVRYLELGPADSTVTILPFYYSYGASVLHTHLAVGARVVIEPNLVFPHVVVETLAKERATGFAGVPSTYALMMGRVKLDKYDLASLRYLTQAGGGMAPALVKRVRATLPAARLFVMYGQTEATARLTYLPPDRLEDKLGSVGVPVHGVEIEVRTESGAPAAPRELGHVCARGPSVMLGFWRDPEATARVVRDGWLDTGDMGYRDEDGYLFLAGRRTDMIKTGAHRLHPAELEEVIAELEGVAEVAIVGVDDDVLGQVVKAFVVADGPAISTDAIKAHCRQRLAVYKVPKIVELVTSLPKTASGKVQRAVLAQSHPREES